MTPRSGRHDLLGAVALAGVVAAWQASWLERHLGAYPPVRHDSAAHFSRALDVSRHLLREGWIGAFGGFDHPALPVADGVVAAATAAIQLAGTSYPDALALFQTFWLTLLAYAVLRQARCLGWQGRWPWPAMLVLGWPSVLEMARELRSELPMMACASLLAAALLPRDAWRRHRGGLSALIAAGGWVKPMAAIVALPACLDAVWSAGGPWTRRWRAAWAPAAAAAVVALWYLPAAGLWLDYYRAHAAAEAASRETGAPGGVLATLLFYASNPFRTHLGSGLVALQAGVGLLWLRLRERDSQSDRNPRAAALVGYWVFGLLALASYGVRTWAGDFLFVAFVIPALLVPWVGLAGSAHPAARRAVPIAAGLVFPLMLLQSLRTPPAEWAGLAPGPVPEARAWGLRQIADAIREEEAERPVRIVVLAAHTVINLHTVRSELLRSADGKADLADDTTAAFYLPPAKGLDHPATRSATHIVAKSAACGPENSWLSRTCGRFFGELGSDPPFPVRAVWARPLELPDGSLLQLYRRADGSASGDEAR